MEPSLDAAALHFPLQQALPSHLSLALIPRLAPLGSSLASHFVPRRLISAHTWSSTPSRPRFSSGWRRVPFLAECLARSSTSSRPLFSLGQCRCLTPQSSTPPPPSPLRRRHNMVASAFDTSSSSWMTPRLSLKRSTSTLMPHIDTPPSCQNASTPLGDTSPWLCPLIDSTAASTFSKPSSGCLSTSCVLLCFLCLGLDLHIQV
jgi:hypothetical protein